MAQLVNSICAICKKRIESVLEGECCAACGSPVHNKCAQRDLAIPDTTKCSSCGSEIKATPQKQSASRYSRRRVVLVLGTFTLLFCGWLGYVCLPDIQVFY